MNELDIQIGKRLRAARLACGYKSARSFAIKHKIPESTYSQHETGKRSLNPEMLCFYSEKFHVHPGWLIHGHTNQLAESNTALIDVQQFKAALKKVLQSESQINAEDADRFVEATFDNYFSAITQ